MNRTLAYGILVAFAATSVSIIAARPAWISDDNLFLKNFVNHELLNLLGVILAITLASVANIHLEFNKIEERYQINGGLSKSRENIRKNARFLIILFVLALALTIVKPLVATNITSEATVNAFALFIVLWHVLILTSLTQLVFAIPPSIPKRKGDE